MKNIDNILAELGIEIPEDKKEAFRKDFNANYKTIAEHQKLADALENQKTLLADAQETLKKYDGKDPSKYDEEVNSWKKKAEEAERTYNAKLAEMEFADALQKELDAVKFSSVSARKAVEGRIKDAGLKLSAGKILGLSDLISQIKEEDAGAFISEAEEKQAKFTEKKGGSGKPMTKEDILKIEDISERQKAIEENISLFE